MFPRPVEGVLRFTWAAYKSYWGLGALQATCALFAFGFFVEMVSSEVSTCGGCFLEAFGVVAVFLAFVALVSVDEDEVFVLGAVPVEEPNGFEPNVLQCVGAGQEDDHVGMFLGV